MNKDELEKYKQSLPPGVREDMKIGGQTEDHVTNSIALGGLYGVSRAALPAIAGWYNKGRLPNEGSISWRELAKNDWLQRGKFGTPETGLKGWDFTRGFRPGVSASQGGFGSGPTPLVRQTVERIGAPTGAGLILHNLVNKYKPKKRK